MKKMNLDQQARLALWPLMAIIFINTFGMLWYVMSDLDSALNSGGSMAISFDVIFRIVLLIVSFIIGYFVYDQQKKRLAVEFTEHGEYNMRGKGVIGLIMHVILGLVEATFVFFTLNTFWLIVNFSEEQLSVFTEVMYWGGFGFIFILSAYFLTRQIALGLLAVKRRA